MTQLQPAETDATTETPRSNARYAITTIEGTLLLYGAILLTAGMIFGACVMAWMDAAMITGGSK